MMAGESVALVTGAGSGIGRATALALLAAGYRVVLAGQPDGHGETKLWTEDFTVNVWHQIAIHVLWSTDEQKGTVDVWFDGVQVVTGHKRKTKADGNTLFYQTGLHRRDIAQVTDTIYFDDFIEADTMVEAKIAAPLPPGGGGAGGAAAAGAAGAAGAASGAGGGAGGSNSGGAVGGGGVAGALGKPLPTGGNGGGGGWRILENTRRASARRRCGYTPGVPNDTPLGVYAFLDYRAFLRDHYVTKKASSRAFSYRAFSKRAGVASPNYLKLVIEGKRSLSPKMAERFAHACGLDVDASRYFVHLVGFNQAKTSVERAQFYDKLTGFQRYRQAHKLELAHAAYYSEWFMPAIRELVASGQFREDPEWIADQLIPPITTVQARQALETLVELGLLVRDEQGLLAQSEPLLSTGPETRGLHIVAFHRAMTQRALESIDLVPKPDRDISSLTLCLGRSGLRNLKERLQRFRRELLELSALEPEPEQVVQLNFQLFPLSRPGKRGGSR